MHVVVSDAPLRPGGPRFLIRPAGRRVPQAIIIVLLFWERHLNAPAGQRGSGWRTSADVPEAPPGTAAGHSNVSATNASSRPPRGMRSTLEP